MIQQINHSISSGKFEEALAMVDEAIKKNNGFALYHEKRAEILMALGNKREAIRALNQSLNLFPQSIYLATRLDFLTKDDTAHVAASGHLYPSFRFCGTWDRAPDITGNRKAEGGQRLRGGHVATLKNLPLVTIVTAVFNNADSLERCILSVKAQDYPNIEHLIIDGGSEEPTLEIILKYESILGYFVSEPDGGIYQAMNKGIRLANGQYVCLLNSDDIYDPTFVRKTVELAEKLRSQVVFTDHIHGETPIEALNINTGIRFGHLNLNHGTFLVSRQCYDLVGPYSEEFRIVSDAIWMREAYKKQVRFDHVNEPLMTFAADGLSSGGTERHRKLFIAEVVRSYLMEFAELQPTEAEDIYLLRFNSNRLDAVTLLGQKYEKVPNFKSALANYVAYCISHRASFQLQKSESGERFSQFCRACRALDIPLSSIRIPTSVGCFSEVIQKIDQSISFRKANPLRTIIHFASVFSAPSETFIYDLLVRLDTQTGFDNFILHDHSKLVDERPFVKSLYIPWDQFLPEVRNAIYLYLFDNLKPDVIIGHFALNSWKLAQRIDPLGITTPMLSMTHGIDVFTLQNEGAYRDYVLKQCEDPNGMRFTTVSHYLRDKLVEFGVPEGKIDIVHNSINPRFRLNHKGRSARRSNDPLRLLAIGRLIDWKGHRYLLQALSIVKARTSITLTLTLVYAYGDTLLEEIRQQIQEQELASSVTLVPFVDFSQETDFYSRFDLFVHPSTYGGEKFDRTETFGMSVLEAIAAGLPVIVTDAGGVPEVVGAANVFARIVPNGDADALAEAIIDAFHNSSTFDNNKDYADERLACFSEEAQILALSKSIFRVMGSGIQAALFSTSTIQGAGYAAYRLHRGLTEGNVVSPTLFTTLRHHEAETGVRVVAHPAYRDASWRALQDPAISKPNLTIFTINHPIILNRTLKKWIEKFDIINLHWTARFLSIENISYLTNSGKPVVLTLRDMYPITGGCHFFHGCDAWLRGCQDCPQLVDHWDNFPAKVLQAKRNHYNFENLTLVALSKHSAEILRRAPYFQNCRIEVIPNSIETELFIPRGRRKAREHLSLPLDRKIIAFVPSYSSEVKGFHEATTALEILKESHPDLDPLILLVGSQPANTDCIPFDTTALGYISDNEALSFAYSAADVVIVPSLEETFSNTTAEAISCGTPVVGFMTGAIPELAIEGQTGCCIEVGDVAGFAQGIARVLTGPDLSQNCRKHAEQYLQFELQARRYETLYTKLLMNPRSPSFSVPEEDLLSTPETTPTVLNLLLNASA